MFRHWGLQKRFAAVFLLFITLPTLLFGSLIYYQATKTYKHQAERNAVDRLEKNEQNLTSIIRSIENMSSYMIYDESFRRFFTTLENERFQPKYKQAEENIKGYFTFQLTSHAFIDSILLVGSEGQTLKFGNPVIADEGALDVQTAIKEGALLWSESYEVTSEWNGEKHVISLSRVINDINNINEPIGMVRIRLDAKKLFNSIEARPTYQYGDYFVVDRTGEVILHHDSSLLGRLYPEQKVIDLLQNENRSYKNIRNDNGAFLAVKKPIKGTSWYSVAVVDEGIIVGEMNKVRTLILLMFLLLIVLGISAFAGFYLNQVKRITELTRKTRQLGSGNFGTRVEVTSRDEIGQLGIHFNTMANMIQSYINREYKLKLKQKETELKALQNQMDPHFLYNTLDMIRWTARLEKAGETGLLIERLSRIFRMNLNNGKTWVRLEEELAYIRNYLELQKKRMGDRLHYHLDVDEKTAEQAYVIKQILQPLVENSIIHGFRDLPIPGIITIRVRRREKEIRIDILDNGRGFAEESASQKTGAGSGFALENISERLEMAFGEEGQLKRMPADSGVWMRLILPFLTKTDVQKLTNEMGETDGNQNDVSR